MRITNPTSFEGCQEIEALPKSIVSDRFLDAIGGCRILLLRYGPKKTENSDLRAFAINWFLAN